MKRRTIVVLAGLLLLWLAAGARRLGSDEFGVLEGVLLPGVASRVDDGWALAPPGLLRLARYPRSGVEVRLPQADEIDLRAEDGSRFGLRGWSTLRARPEAWQALHSAARGRGLGPVLAEALAEVSDLFSPSRGASVLEPHRKAAAEEALSAALFRRGVELRSLDLDALDFLSTTLAEAEVAPETRLLVVGLDGADWAIIDPLIEQGRMPHLAGLVQRGARADLLSVRPMLSPVIWTSVATGVEPRRHGILDFLVTDSDGGSRQPVTSAQRQVPTFWELLSGKGVEVGVVGWWASWPADPVRGYLVSDRIAYQLFGFRADPEDATGKTWPPELYDDVKELIVTPDSIEGSRVETFLGASSPGFQSEEDAERMEEFRTLLASGDSYAAIASSLEARFKPRLQIVYFEGTDTVGHLFMPYRAPSLPEVSEGAARRYGEVIDRYYEEADRMLGRLLESRDERWTVMVLSDHGFASDATRPRTTDSRIGHGAAADWHRRFGILVLSGAAVRAGVTLEEASVYDIAPTVLSLFGLPIPRDWPGRVLTDALTEEFTENHPIRFTHESPARGSQAEVGDLDPGAADLLQKLTSLGYLSASGDGAESVTALNNTGIALMSEGRFDEAESMFRTGLAQNPNAANLLANLGVVLRLQRRDNEAEPYLRRALDHPTTRRLAALQLARMQFDLEEYAEAEELLRGALSEEPLASDLHGTLGQVLEKQGQRPEAEQSYRLAAEIDPHNAWARNDLGNLLQRQGDTEQAASAYRDAIEADPYFIGPYNNLALIYQRQGRVSEAVDLYERASIKAPNSAIVVNNLASLHYALGDYPRAEAAWRRCAELDPEYPSPLSNLAGLLISTGRSTEAQELLQQALRLDPRYGDARINLSVILRGRGETDAARRELGLAAEDPRAAGNALFELGLLELRERRFAAAVSALEQSRAINPRRIDLLNALGQAYVEQGDSEKGLDLWRESLRLAPGQRRLTDAVSRLEQTPTP